MAVAAKSMSLNNFEPLTHSMVHFYSLQKINGTEQLEAVDSHVSIVDFGHEIDEEHGDYGYCRNYYEP